MIGSGSNKNVDGKYSELQNFSAPSLDLNAFYRKPQSFVSRFGTTSSCAVQNLQIQKNNTGNAGDKKKNNDNHGDEKHKNDHIRVQ